MKISRVEIKSSIDTLSKHRHFSNEEAAGVLVVFPGGNSSCDAPIIQFIETGLFNDGFDILEISYNGLVKPGGENVVDNICNEINKAFEEVVDGKYDKVFVLSRSFGNVISTKLRIEYNKVFDSQVYLAPIPDSVDSIIELGGLVISGTKDSYISMKELERLKNLNNVELKLIEKANHSLENDDSIELTIDFAKDVVMSSLMEFQKKY